MRVCFTGPAFGPDGQSILRADLFAAAKAAGHWPEEQLSIGTDVLVASREDTCKAKKAAQRGIPVMTYPTFISQHMVGTPIVKLGNKLNPWVDAKAALIPDFTAEDGLSDADLL